MLRRGVLPDGRLLSALGTVFGVDFSSGRCISRMDGDDVMPDNKLQLFYDRLKERKGVMVTGKVRYFSDQPISKG